MVSDHRSTLSAEGSSGYGLLRGARCGKSSPICHGIIIKASLQYLIAIPSNMSATFEYVFDTPSYKGTAKINTDLFIGGKWVPSVDDSPKIEYVPVPLPHYLTGV